MALGVSGEPSTPATRPVGVGLDYEYDNVIIHRHRMEEYHA